MGRRWGVWLGWVLGACLAASSAAHAGVSVKFPATLYTHTTPAGPYSKDATTQLGLEVAALEAQLGIHLGNIPTIANFDTSAELRAIVTDETGSGLLVFNDTPTILTPVLGSYTVATLPVVGIVGRIARVTDAASSGDCVTGGNPGTFSLCVDNGSAWVNLGGGGSATNIILQKAGSAVTPSFNSVNFIGSAITGASGASRMDVTLAISPSAATSVVGTSRQVSTTSPLVGGGDLGADRTITFQSQSQNIVFAGPTSGAAVPAFRALVANDIPALDAAKITTGTFIASQIPALDTSKLTTGFVPLARGGLNFAPTIAKGTVIAGTGAGTLGTLVVGADGLCVKADSSQATGLAYGTCGTGSTGYASILEEGGAALTARSTVNFVGGALTAVDNAGATRTDVTLSQSPNSASVVGTGRVITATSPITIAGTTSADLSADRTIALANQAANIVLAGPSSGGSAAPGFRALVALDIPALDAAKITTGTFGTGMIPNLDAAKITTGTFAMARGGLNADLSGIAKGGLIGGTGVGSVGILVAGPDTFPVTYDSTQSTGLRTGGALTVTQPFGIGFRNHGDADMRIGLGQLGAGSGLETTRTVFGGRTTIWQASTSFKDSTTSGNGYPEYVHPVPPNGSIYQVVTGGVSGSTAPNCTAAANGANCWPRGWYPKAPFAANERAQTLFGGWAGTCSGGSNSGGYCGCAGAAGAQGGATFVCPSATCTGGGTCQAVSGSTGVCANGSNNGTACTCAADGVCNQTSNTRCSNDTARPCTPATQATDCASATLGCIGRSSDCTGGGACRTLDHRFKQTVSTCVAGDTAPVAGNNGAFLGFGFGSDGGTTRAGSCVGGSRAGRCCVGYGTCAVGGAYCDQLTACGSGACTYTECPGAGTCTGTINGCTVTAANGGADGTCEWQEDGRSDGNITEGTVTWGPVDRERVNDQIVIDSSTSLRGHLIVRNYDNDASYMLAFVGTTGLPSSNPFTTNTIIPYWSTQLGEYRTPTPIVFQRGPGAGPTWGVYAENYIAQPSGLAAPTATAGGNLPAGGYAITYTWESAITGGRTQYAPASYVFLDGSTNKSYSVALPTFPANVTNTIVYEGSVAETAGNCQFGKTTKDPALYLRVGTATTTTFTNAGVAGQNTEHEIASQLNYTGTLVAGAYPAGYGPWAASTTYFVGAVVRPTNAYRTANPTTYSHAFAVYGTTATPEGYNGLSCISGGTEPTWSLTPGSFTAEAAGTGFCRWKEIGSDRPALLLHPADTNQDAIQVKTANGSNNGLLSFTVKESGNIWSSGSLVLGTTATIAGALTAATGGTTPSAIGWSAGQSVNGFLVVGTSAANSSATLDVVADERTADGKFGCVRVANVGPGGDGVGNGWYMCAGATGTNTGAGNWSLRKFNGSTNVYMLIVDGTTGNVTLKSGANLTATGGSVALGATTVTKDGATLSPMGTVFVRTADSSPIGTGDLSTVTLAGAPAVNRVYHVHTGGTYTWTSGTVTYTATMGGVAVCAPAAITPTTLGTYEADLWITIRAAGNPATVQCNGYFRINNNVSPATAPPTQFVNTNTTTAVLTGTPVLKTTSAVSGTATVTEKTAVFVVAN